MVVKENEIVVNSGGKNVSLIINSSDQAGQGGHLAFVLGHGASGDARSGNLPMISKHLAEQGILVVRYNTSGNLNGRIKSLQAILESKHAMLSGVTGWILSGHSMGGRTACAVALQRTDIRAVVLFSYPLHPPGKQGQLRDKDLCALQIPVMIVRGTKDPFSTPAVFEEVMTRMSTSKLSIQTVEGGDHSLGTKTKIGQQRFDEWMPAVTAFIDSLSEDATAQAHSQPDAAEVEDTTAATADSRKRKQRESKATENAGSSKEIKKAVRRKKE